jgi:hypothetical protein
MKSLKPWVVVQPRRHPFELPFDNPFEGFVVRSGVPLPSHIGTTRGPETTGNNPNCPEAETPATVGFRPVFPGQRAPQKWVVLGLITRRSRVQIPPPATESPGQRLAGQGLLPFRGGPSPGFRGFLQRLYQGFLRTCDLRVFWRGLRTGGHQIEPSAHSAGPFNFG